VQAEANTIATFFSVMRPINKTYNKDAKDHHIHLFIFCRIGSN
jgi:hypothetical protein